MHSFQLSSRRASALSVFGSLLGALLVGCSGGDAPDLVFGSSGQNGGAAGASAGAPSAAGSSGAAGSSAAGSAGAAAGQAGSSPDAERTCCEPSDSPGCSASKEIEDCVCQKDAFCCTKKWDAVCVQKIHAYQCSEVCTSGVGGQGAGGQGGAASAGGVAGAAGVSGASGSAGAASGSGGSGGIGSALGVGGDCGLEMGDPSCNKCLQGSCCAPAQNCASISECVEVLDCMTACGDNWDCAQSCFYEKPFGAEILGQFFQCVVDNCPTWCLDSGGAGAGGSGSAGAGSGGGAGGTGPSGCGLELAGPPDCAECFQNKCCEVSKACVDNQACIDMLQCANSCANLDCYQQCQSDHPVGAEIYENMTSCIGTSCSQECVDPGGAGGASGAGGSGFIVDGCNGIDDDGDGLIDEDCVQGGQGGGSNECPGGCLPIENNSCGSAFPLSKGVHHDGVLGGLGTPDGHGLTQGSCGGGSEDPGPFCGNGPEAIFRYTVAQAPVILKIHVESSYGPASDACAPDLKTVLYVRKTCDNPFSEVICGRPFESPDHIVSLPIFEAGDYHLFVDGWNGDEGLFSIWVQEDLPCHDSSECVTEEKSICDMSKQLCVGCFSDFDCTKKGKTTCDPELHTCL